MGQPAYPRPTRLGYVASPWEPDENGVLDVGYALGRLSDGRPYRLECWRMDEMLMATIMFSSLYLEGYCRRDMPLLLELEGIVSFDTGKGRPRLQAAQTRDDAGQAVWALNVQLAAGQTGYARVAVPLQRYR